MRRAWQARTWQAALLVAAPLALAYLIAAPAAGDLAAATYRSDLFARVGFSAWDTGWYAAHGYWLPSYSLLSPALGALLGVRLLLALSALAAALLFAFVAERLLPPRAAAVAAATFALGIGVGMLSGRVPFDLGVAIALGAVLALPAGRPKTAPPTGRSNTRPPAGRSKIGARLLLALALAALSAVTSPVVGAFLALAGLAYATVDARRGLSLALAAIVPVLVLGLAYPNGGYEPFAATAFWPALAAVALIAALLPRGPFDARAHRALRAGAALYALALIAAYAIHTPMGSNATRLGPLLAPPLVAGVLWPGRRARSSGEQVVRGLRRAPARLALLAPLLLYWQLATPLKDYVSLAGDPSVNASYYAPLLAELRRLTAGRATIVEVPLSKAHWEAAQLPWHDGVRLARGWERQLDTRYAAIFYEPTLTAGRYRAWLAANRVRYVALPDAPLDAAGAREGALVARGLPYLRELWRSRHWRLYAVGD